MYIHVWVLIIPMHQGVHDHLANREHWVTIDRLSNGSAGWRGLALHASIRDKRQCIENLTGNGVSEFRAITRLHLCVREIVLALYRCCRQGMSRALPYE